VIRTKKKVIIIKLTYLLNINYQKWGAFYGKKFQYTRSLIFFRLKYLFSPHFRSVCCGWSSFWQSV